MLWEHLRSLQKPLFSAFVWWTRNGIEIFLNESILDISEKLSSTLCKFKLFWKTNAGGILTDSNFRLVHPCCSWSSAVLFCTIWDISSQLFCSLLAPFVTLLSIEESIKMDWNCENWLYFQVHAPINWMWKRFVNYLFTDWNNKLEYTITIPTKNL